MTPTRDQMRVLADAQQSFDLGSPRDVRPLDMARWSCRQRGWIDAQGQLTPAGTQIYAMAVHGRIVFYTRIGPRTWSVRRTYGPVFWDLRA